MAHTRKNVNFVQTAGKKNTVFYPLWNKKVWTNQKFERFRDKSGNAQHLISYTILVNHRERNNIKKINKKTPQKTVKCLRHFFK